MFVLNRKGATIKHHYFIKHLTSDRVSDNIEMLVLKDTVEYSLNEKAPEYQEPFHADPCGSSTSKILD